MTPSFDWNTTEQYDDFQLFHKSVESWFTLQNIPAETPQDPTVEPNSTRLKYVLNFLGNTGCRKFDHWKPTGTADEIARKKKWASAFMDYLSSTMDHAVSQHCRIYQLEDVCIWPGESPDELVDCLQALADWCDFPTEDKKGMEHPVQIRKSPRWQGTHQEATSPRSDGNNIQGCLKCATHTLPSQTTLRPWDWRNRKQSMPYGGKTSLTKGENLWQIVHNHVDVAQSPTHLADHHAQQGMTTVRGCGKLGLCKPKCQSGQKRTQGQGTQTPKQRRKTEEGQRKLELMKTPMMMKLVLSQLFCQTPFHKGTTNRQIYEEQCWS